MGLQADVKVDGSLDRSVDAAAAALGPLTGLVVSAGIFEPSPIGEMTVDF